jgi:hypothetical protein
MKEKWVKIDIETKRLIKSKKERGRMEDRDRGETKRRDRGREIDR